MFTLAGLIGVVVTALAWNSRSYRRLAATPADPTPAQTEVAPEAAPVLADAAAA